MVIGTLAVDGSAVTFGTARKGLGGLGLSSLYQMYQLTQQRPVYQLHVIRFGIIIFALYSVNSMFSIMEGKCGFLYVRPS